MAKAKARAVTVGAKVVDAHALEYVALELGLYKARQRRLEEIKTAIATERPGADYAAGSRPSGTTSDPSLAAVLRIEADEEVRALEQKLRRTRAGLESLTEQEKEILADLFVNGNRTVTEMSVRLDRDERTVRRIKNEALYKVGIALGVCQ